jgi:stage II sporulation protein AA (anti-sigma F factor antagonist)
MSSAQEIFSVRCADDGRTYTVACRGEIDASATRAMRDATLHALNSRRQQIVVDLHDVSFMDSTGVNALLLAHKAAEIAGVDLRIVPATDAVMRTIEIAGAHQLLDLAHDSGH